jgi:hypothetical protein
MIENMNEQHVYFECLETVGPAQYDLGGKGRTIGYGIMTEMAGAQRDL